MGGRSLKARAIDASRPPGEGEAALLRRVGSAEFRRALEELIGDELAAAASQPLRNLIDAAVVRDAVGAWDPAIARPDAIARIVVGCNQRAEKRLRKERRSPDEIMGPELRQEIDALLDEELPNPEALEQILAQVIRQRFVRRLFAELIHAAILAFNKRVNPFFSGITAAVLEDQIKAFIELGMPMLQEQAVSFAVSRANQQFAVDLARSLICGVLAEPVADLVPSSSAEQRKRIERIVAQLLTSARFRSAAPSVAQRLWDDVYAEIRDKKLAALVDVERLAASLAAPLADLAIATLSRPRVAALLAAALGPLK